MDIWGTIGVIGKVLMFVWFVGLCWIVSGHTKRLDRIGEHKSEDLTDIRELIEDLDDNFKTLEGELNPDGWPSGLSRMVALERIANKLTSEIDILKSGDYGNSLTLKALTDKAFELGRIQENLDKMGDSMAKTHGMLLEEVKRSNERITALEDRMGHAVDEKDIRDLIEDLDDRFKLFDEDFSDFRSGISTQILNLDRAQDKAIIGIDMVVPEDRVFVENDFHPGIVDRESVPSDRSIEEQYVKLSNDFASYREKVIQMFGYPVNASIEEELLKAESEECCEIKQEVISAEEIPADVISSEKFVPEKVDPNKIG